MAGSITHPKSQASVGSAEVHRSIMIHVCDFHGVLMEESLCVAGFAVDYCT